jgi:bacterial/archaeal transporter family-2 protein
MMLKYIDWIWAILAGALLATMVTINSALAGFTTPFTASWVVHGVGALAAAVLLMGNVALARRAGAVPEGARPPLWSYLGGAPGAFAVALSSIAVNSELALAGGLSLLLVGQILFGLVSDQFGLFGTPKRGLNRFDFLAALCVIGGSALLIFSKGA